MTVLARSCWHIFSTEARARVASVSARSRSMTLPCRTPSTPLKPSEPKACAMALPCGSSTPGLSMTWTRAFMVSLHRLRSLEVAGTAFGQNAEAPRHFLIGLLDPAQILAEAVLVHLLVGLEVPEATIVRADLIGQDEAHLFVLEEAAEFELEVDELDADTEKE